LNDASFLYDYHTFANRNIKAKSIIWVKNMMIVKSMQIFWGIFFQNLTPKGIEPL